MCDGCLERKNTLDYCEECMDKMIQGWLAQDREERESLWEQVNKTAEGRLSYLKEKIDLGCDETAREILSIFIKKKKPCHNAETICVIRVLHKLIEYVFNNYAPDPLAAKLERLRKKDGQMRQGWTWEPDIGGLVLCSFECTPDEAVDAALKEVDG